jgi:hypothetical protein
MAAGQGDANAAFMLGLAFEESDDCAKNAAEAA